ncbi:hypothetical protein BDV19DRAFT_350173 [Aspergillus venezuelensis]
MPSFPFFVPESGPSMQADDISTRRYCLGGWAKLIIVGSSILTGAITLWRAH